MQGVAYFTKLSISVLKMSHGTNDINFLPFETSGGGTMWAMWTSGPATFPYRGGGGGHGPLTFKIVPPPLFETNVLYSWQTNKCSYMYVFKMNLKVYLYPENIFWSVKGTQIRSLLHQHSVKNIHQVIK